MLGSAGLMGVCLYLASLLIWAPQTAPQAIDTVYGSDRSDHFFDEDSPLGTRYEDERNDASRLLMAEMIDGAVFNTGGHRILEDHNNGSYSLELRHNGGASRQLTTTTSIYSSSSINYLNTLTLMYDPPNNSFTPCALGVYVHSSSASAKIYYEFETVSTGKATYPTLSSAYATRDAPYIEMTKLFGGNSNRRLTIVAVDIVQGNMVRSKQYTLHLTVEGDARPNSFGFLVPSPETKGHFVKFAIEMAAVARAQVAGGQEFADFYSYLGVGPYRGQITPLQLTDLHEDLTGFEGGYSVNCTATGKYYGVLAPYHNGKKFTGKVVRVDLVAMTQNTSCLANYRMESKDGSGNTVVSGPGTSAGACVSVIDLTSMHANARGFRRGFAGYPYVYLSPGQFNVAARLDVCNWGIDTAKLIDLGAVNKSYGGYSGGFQDGKWSCFNPFRTFTGPFGGLRSDLPVDLGHLRTYYHSYVLCINAPAWTTTQTAYHLYPHFRQFDLEDVDVELRGFSEAIRVGRYVYLIPQNERPHTYAGKLVRIYLGTVDIGTTLDALKAAGKPIREVVYVLNLKLKHPDLKGFSGGFNIGKYLILVPYRNKKEAFNGQRGHGKVVRVDLNIFDLAGTEILEVNGVIRSQIPSFADEDLRGFSGGFCSGKYALLVPYYNAIFNGKVARFIAVGNNIAGNVQELDMMADPVVPEIYRAFRSGFVSLWPGA